MKSNAADKIQMTSLDDLLGVNMAANTVSNQSPIDGSGEDRIVRLPLSVMHKFKDHPFRVVDDEKMAETIESVGKYGVLVPGIARPAKDYPGEYEIVAGHRRHYASGSIGLPDMPFIIKNLSDDEATVIMVDTNIQREDLLPSEKAKAYRMKYDALKRMGRTEEGIRNDEKLAKKAGESRNTIQRYIRLTYLYPDLLQLVDDNKLPKNTAVDISYLKLSEQKKLLQIMLQEKCIPSGEQARKLKEYSKAGNLTETVMELVLERKEDVSKVSLNGREIRKYFPETYTGKQIEGVIYKLLEEWQEREGNKL